MGGLKEKFSQVHFGQAALCSLAFSFFFAVAVPFQTFLGNTEMFDYGMGDLLPELLTAWFVLFLFSFTVEILTEPFMGRLAHLGFVTLAAFGYLEAGIFSVGLPQLNGELWLLCRPSIRQYLDLWIFCAAAIAIFFFRKSLYAFMHWAALGILVMSVAFMLDVGGKSNAAPLKTAFDDGFCPAYDMVKSVELSTNRNVIVVIVDSAPADILDQVMRENPELCSHFPGFTAFPNNIGMHDNTTRGMPAFMTGRYLERDTSYVENIASFWGADSAVSSFKNAGYDIYARLYVGDSYTNRRKFHSAEGKPPKSQLSLFRYTKGEPYITLTDIVAFKLMLYRRKHWIIANAMRSGRAKAFKEQKNLTREWELYPLLEELPVSEKVSRAFCLFHSEGVHIPVPKDGRGVDLPEPDQSRDAIKEYLPYVMSYVAGFMDSLRAKNVYDNSMIVIAADHGILYDAKSAMLWVKPFGAKGAYSTNCAPTSHSQIAWMLKDSVEDDLNMAQIVELLSQKRRLLRIRQSSPDKWWQFGRTVDTYDIFFDATGTEISRKNLGEFKVN